MTISKKSRMSKAALRRTITGNAAITRSTARKGDTLFRRGGDVRSTATRATIFFIGGSGADHTNGGAGTDTSRYSRDADGLSVVSGVTVSLKDRAAAAENAAATSSTVSRTCRHKRAGLSGGLQFGGDDTITGNGVNNVLNGLSGTIRVTEPAAPTR